MPANPWELRADVRPLEAAARRWTEVSALISRRGGELVDAARRATEGWDAASAESYEQHRKQVLARLDRFTTLADLVADCLRAAAEVMTSSQKELDRAWTTVAAVPHEVVGESRHLVFKPSEDDERGKVTRGQAETEEIRGRLTVALDQESSRLRWARAEMVTVRTELVSLTGGSFGGLLGGAGGPAGTESGIVVVAPSPASTSVDGSAQAGVAALPPLAPVAVSVPDLTGLSSAGLTSLAASAAGGRLGRRDGTRLPAGGTPPIGGMAAGGMAARAGTMSRGMASGRGGSARMSTPRLERTAAEEPAARAAREKEALREAKRAALEEKRAERAARKAERAAARDAPPSRTAGKESRRDDEHDKHEHERDEDLDGTRADAGGDDPPGSGGRRESVRVVHEAAPGRPVGEQRR